MQNMQLPSCNIVCIDDPNDPRLEPYQDIKDRDLLRSRALFMGEGRFVIERMFASKRIQTLSVLTTPSRLKALDTHALSKDVVIYSVEQSVMDTVAGFSIHRGYLALGRYSETRSFDDFMKDHGAGPLRIMALSKISNTDNLGGLMRNAAAFGVDCVLLDDVCCNPLYRKSIRVSMGAVFDVPYFFVPNIITALKAHNITPYGLSPNGAQKLEDLKAEKRSAFLFGAEGEGLDEATFGACLTVRIDMKNGFDSLNVATTSGIVLYSLGR